MVKNITVVAVTTVNHELTKRAIDRTTSQCHCTEVLVASDKDFYSGSSYVKIDQNFDIGHYNDFMLKQLVDYVNTDYALIVQYDGMAVNKHLWTDSFLDYDYIGAPWFWMPVNCRVGNGGFSLRSRKLLEKLAELEYDSQTSEDQVICQLNRAGLESLGCKFAPTDLAHRFSHEREAGWYASFGFHGGFNVPFYLDYAGIKEYIQLVENRTSPNQLEIIPYCYAKGYLDLADLGIELGRQSDKQFDDKFGQYLQDNSSRFNFLLNQV